jgi:type I restriction enzyme S subunit
LFSDLDAGVLALARVKANLKRYRAAVLKAAVEGKLTEEWRRQNPTVEPADKLLARILDERRKNWEQEQLRKYAEAGNTPPKGWRDRYSLPEPVENHERLQVPENWCWVTVDGLAYVTKLAGFEYTKYVKYDDAGDLAVLKAENAGKEGFRRTAFSRVRSDTVKHLERSQLHGGEVLMVFVGIGVGQVARVPAEQQYFLGPNIGMIRVESAELTPAYLEMFLRSPAGFRLTLSFAKAVAQPSLSMGTIRKIPIAVPPLREQEQICMEVERRLSVAEKVAAEVEASLQRAARLRQAVLKRAFKGKLVPQDPCDEPAAVLLAKLREQQAAAAGTSSASRPRGRNSKNVHV